MHVEAFSSESHAGHGPAGQTSSTRHPTRRWPGWVGLVTLLGLSGVAAVVITFWTQGGSSTGSDVPVNAEMSHVHGLGTNSEDGATYVATHSGVFKLGDKAAPVRVADRYQDTMGFTVAGPDRFLASGHPDLTDASMPTHLGLIESTDAAMTWQQLSLGGAADLHALDFGPGGIVAFDAVAGQLIRSDDGKEWSTVAEGAVIDLAIAPVKSGAMVATTPDGELFSYDARGSGELVPAAPRIGLVDWPRADLLVGAGADGQLYRSADSGQSWSPIGDPLGTLQAIDVSEGAWLAATQQAVLRSTDEGITWEPLVRFGD